MRALDVATLSVHALTPSVCSPSQYCDAGLVNEVVVPLLSMQSSVLLCISTLLDGANHYSSCRSRCLALFPPPAHCLSPPLMRSGKMIGLKDEFGAPVFESLQISLVCGMQNYLSRTIAFCLPLCVAYPPAFVQFLSQTHASKANTR